MPVEVIMPKVDMDMERGTLAAWHAVEGARVEKGAPLFDIETDKAAMEVESPATGRLHHLAARPGDRVPVGTTLAWLYADGEPLAAAPDAPPSPAGAAGPEVGTADVAAGISVGTPGASPATTADPSRDGADAGPGPGSAPLPTALQPVVPASSAPPGATRGHAASPHGVAPLRATPAARSLARQHGLALGGIAGTGPRGRIQRADVDGLAATRAAMPPAFARQYGPLAVTRRAGTGRPLVLLHGFAADSFGWLALERMLPADRPLIRIDLPCHGASPRRAVTGFPDLARQLVEAFDDATRDLPADLPVHLLGHSLGGALALAIADIRPRRVASVTLLAPAGLGPEMDADVLAGIARATRIESLAPWLRCLTATPEGTSDDLVRAAMAARRDPALRMAQSAMADVLFPDGVQAFDLRPALGRLTAPAQILWGRADRILPWRHALAADGETAIHLLSGTGHLPQLECPDRVARLIVRLLAAAEGSRPAP